MQSIGYPLNVTNWLARAANEPAFRRVDRLPETLDFREYATPFKSTYRNVPDGAEIGFPMILRDSQLHFPTELTLQARYVPFTDGGRFVGTFHVHPAAPGKTPAPFFDPHDLASALRSDSPGFIELLLAADTLFALVRTNPFLYISAHHVNRNPGLLLEQHREMLHRNGAMSPLDPDYARNYRAASLYFFDRYDLALYEGKPESPLIRTFTPRKRW